jgi:hypothetical protein
MRKPMDMKIRDYVDCLLEINRYLKYFPTNTVERTTVLPNDEIMDILTYGIPNTWQKKIFELSFDTRFILQMSLLNCVSEYQIVNRLVLMD